MTEVKKIVLFQDVAYKYPAGNNALEKIRLEISTGEILGLVGANGSGKTTFLKILAGQLEKTDGTLLIQGRPIEEFTPSRLSEMITLLEQNPENQMIGPTVEDELARACRMNGLEGRPIRDKVEQVLSLVGMKQAKDWFLEEMSCGEKRRIALALAMISDPVLILLDEPLADLDPKGIEDTLTLLIELKHRGIALLIASHKMEDILGIVDRLVLLKEGKILYDDRTQKVLAQVETQDLLKPYIPEMQRLYLELRKEGLLPNTGTIPLTFSDTFSALKKALRKKAGDPDTTVLSVTAIAALL